MPILETIQGDVLHSGLPIVFAINTEGANDAGFAGLVSHRFWPDLAQIGPCDIGSVVAKEAVGHRFYGVVCHTLHDGSWKLDTITRALDQIADQLGVDNPVAVIWMGHGLVGRLTGVDPEATKAAIHSSRLPTHLYHL